MLLSLVFSQFSSDFKLRKVIPQFTLIQAYKFQLFREEMSFRGTITNGDSVLGCHSFSSEFLYASVQHGVVSCSLMSSRKHLSPWILATFSPWRGFQVQQPSNGLKWGFYRAALLAIPLSVSKFRRIFMPPFIAALCTGMLERLFWLFVVS